MKGKIKNLIITLVVIGVLLLPIIIDYYGEKTLDVITFEEYTTEVQSGEPSIIYYGDIENEDYKNISKTLTSMQQEFSINVKALNYKKLSIDEIAQLFDQKQVNDSQTGLLFIKHMAVEYIHEGDIAKKDLEALINKYFNNVLLEDEVAYIVPKDAKTYNKIINSKEVVMTVFGRSNCSWCQDYKPVYNDIANKYKFKVYVFESDLYNDKEYKKVMNLGLKIPKSCINSEEDKSLAEGFGTPLTLFTKNGKVIDCINGYKSRVGLEAKLSSIGMIK